MFHHATFREIWAPRLLSVARIMIGLLFMQHGLMKLIGFPAPAPANFQFLSLFGLAAVIEVVGGAMLIVGFYTRLAAFIMAGEMAVAYWIVVGRPSRGFFPLVNGGELESLYCFAFLALVAAGPGSWSFDRQQNRA